jgi:hypothetical protein
VRPDAGVFADIDEDVHVTTMLVPRIETENVTLPLLLAVKLVLAGVMLSSLSAAASAVVAARPARAAATVAARANFLAVRIMIGFLLLERDNARQLVS